ncbi:MAG: metal-binding protein [Caballeronia sp.]|nr:metal-binding protein [Caballeronia sp.]
MNSISRTFDRGAPAEANFEAYANPLVAESLEHASALEGGVDAEMLHRLRVASRQCEHCSKAYRPILNEKFDNEQRELFKSLANAADNTRDWDILISLLQKGNDGPLVDALKKGPERNCKKERRDAAQLAVRQLASRSGQRSPP